MPRLRLGVVLLLPPRPAVEVDVVRRALGGAEAVHHVAPHLTLVPPVNVREERLADVEALVRGAAARTRPFTATLGPPTTFLPDNPVLHLAVGPEEVVATVEQLREHLFLGPLARDVTWPFVPHVTLLDGSPPERITASVHALADLVVDVTFDAVTLLREQRDDEGRRIWRPILDAPFGGPAVVARGGLPLELEVGPRLAHDAAAWSEAAWDDHDRALSGPTWVPAEPVAVAARRDGEVVGVATGALRDGESHLERLIVDRSVRGEGVGAHLLAAFTSEVAGRGASRLVLRTLAGGPAERFYLDRGFAVVTTLPRWRRGEDFVLLQRTLR